MVIKYHGDVLQGSDEWMEARCGLLTASEVKFLLTDKTLKVADNKDSRAHVFELLAQRITKYTEPSFFSHDMDRGTIDEVEARILYSKNISLVTETGFVTNDEYGFTLGYSPDGLVGEDGLIEIKSRKQKLQTETIFNNEMPTEFNRQIQTGLLVTKRKWCDFISYCGGMPLFVKRIVPCEKTQQAIIEAGFNLEANIKSKLETYNKNIQGSIITERIERNDYGEISV
ncbi:YqaJ-like viral recombinase [Candidatus Wolfebacteria bacterium]|nr:MAG: YqaJ-like viral recombinase [Candidatus Wolfebacteria bacterium]